MKPPPGTHLASARCVPRGLVRFVLGWGLCASLGGDARATPPADLPLPSLEELSVEGAAWLFPGDVERLAARSPAERVAGLQALLADPAPETPVNELLEGARRRRALMLSESLTTTDVRARLLFLLGLPSTRQRVDCDLVFRPLEIWSYGRQRVVVYQPDESEPFRLWLPNDGKRALYTVPMGDALEDFPRRRFDHKLCKVAPAVDAATGLAGLSDPLPGGPDPRHLRELLAPPTNLAAWARAAAVEVVAPAVALPVEPLDVSYTRQRGQRLEARVLVVLPPGAPLVPAIEANAQGEERRELRLAIEGVIEHEGALFDSFRMRFLFAPSAGDAAPTVLAVARALRPGSYVVRLRVRDEVGGALAVVGGPLEVPTTPQPPAARDVAAIEPAAPPGEPMDRTLAGVEDGLLLVVPPVELVFDSLRAQVMVKGDRIRKVAFLLDGQVQLTRVAPPWSVEVKLPRIPREQLLRAEGYDLEGRLVAADEVALNQLKGRLAVRILAPPPGRRVVGETIARAEVVVPEDRRVREVDFLVNEKLQARLDRPAWEAKVHVPDEVLTYLTVSAELDDNSRQEAVRILASPQAMEQVDVSLVELYTTVTDPGGELVRGLSVADFDVREEGRRQKLARAELVEDRPLVVGVTLDVSGSMQQALGEAQRAAATFLRSIVGPRDRCFAVAFSTRPSLVMPRTSDAASAAEKIAELRAEGATSLNDAVVLSLYYFRGSQGRRAMVLLSDGADTDSLLPFDDALAYARDSGVVIYSVGLQTEALDLGARRKLEQLAAATGGRSFFIANADQLAGVYERIESELRSQYLLAYAPVSSTQKGFRRVQVRVARPGATARTIPGYTP